jgi:hypothetical protein
MGYKLQNLIGQIFGKLTVTKLLDSKQYGNTKKRMWECECECGKISIVSTGQLTSGKTKSCGCLHKISSVQNSINSRHKIIKVDAASNSIYSQYRNNAKARNYIFELTKEQFKILITSNCFYCGSEPLNLHHNSYYKMFYNGIDRLDNTIGYTLDNSVSCCKMCNISKNKHDVDYFLDWIKKVYNHNFKK